MGAHLLFFFFNDTATTEIYTLSLHDALPISAARPAGGGHRRSVTGSEGCGKGRRRGRPAALGAAPPTWKRSEEHTSELQSQSNLVCRLLLEKKKQLRHTGQLRHRRLSTPHGS